MTRHYYIDDWRSGTEVSATIRTEEPSSGLAMSFFATAGGSCGILVDDPSLSLDLVGWHPFYMTEDEADPIRIFTGIILGKKIHSLDDAGSTEGRVWDCDLVDLNRILGMQTVKGADANRPAETDGDRIDWLLNDATGGIAGLVFDNGGVLSGAHRPFGPADLRHTNPESILSNLALDLRLTCLYWDETAATGEEISLWYNPYSTTRGLLDAKLSNITANIDESTVFAAHSVSLALSRSPEDVYDEIDFTYRTGQLLRTNPSTTATFFAQMGDGFHRTLVYTTDRIDALPTASNRADEMIVAASVEKDTITCDVRVTAAQANVFREGFGVQCQFSHLPGYSADYVTLTILERTIKTIGVDWYDLGLTLVAGAPSGVSSGEGGGSPGDFPKPPAPTSLHYYEGSLVFFDVNGGGGGWGWTGPAAVGDTTVTVLPNSDGAVFQPNVTYNVHVTVTAPNPSDMFGIGVSLDESHVYPPGTTNIGWIVNPPNSANYSADLTFTTPLTLPPNTRAYINAKAQAAVAGQNITVTWYVDPDGWVTPTDQPPEPHQWVYGEVLSMAGAVGTTVWPYAAGSTRVRVDGVPISAASYTETDPGAGTVTLSWTPDADEVVTIDYQGL